MLVWAELRQNWHSPPGKKKCDNPRCKTCTILITESTFSRHDNGENLHLKVNSNINVIYMIQCKRCGKQYVGETGTSPKNERPSNRSHTQYTGQTSCRPLQRYWTLSGWHFHHGDRETIEEWHGTEKDKGEQVNKDFLDSLFQQNELKNRFSLASLPVLHCYEYLWNS